MALIAIHAAVTYVGCLSTAAAPANCWSKHKADLLTQVLTEMQKFSFCLCTTEKFCALMQQECACLCTGLTAVAQLT